MKKSHLGACVMARTVQLLRNDAYCPIKVEISAVDSQSDLRILLWYHNHNHNHNNNNILCLPLAVFIALMLEGPSKCLKQIIRVKNPKWPEANQLAIYKRDRVRIWTREYREQIQLAVREGLELGASELKVGQIVFMRVQTLRACLHGHGWPQIGEVRFRGSPHLSRKPLNMIN